MKLSSRKKFLLRLSAWITLQALVAVQSFPPFAYAQPKEISKEQTLRVEQQEPAVEAGELSAQLRAGAEEPATVKEAAQRYFGQKSGRKEEITLEEFLARDEDRIQEFIRLIETDRRNAGLLSEGQSIGPYRFDPIDFKKVPAPGQHSGSGELAIEIPSDKIYYERERLRLMARAAIQRALGKEIVVNIGIGFVGTAVTTATAAESRRDYGKIPAGKKGKLAYRAPLEGKQEAYFTIAYQRPSPASAYKVPAINRGMSPIATKDLAVGEKIREATQKGNLVATYLPEVIAIADTIMLETELHVAKVLPTHLEHAQIEDKATIRLIQQVGQLMRPDALVIVESTIAPGFTRNRLLPALNEELEKRKALSPGQDANLAHAFQRLEPGLRWYQSLLEQERVGAGVTDEANRKLADYFQMVGFRYRIMPKVEAVEFMKTLENAWRFGLLELMSAYLRAGEIVGVDTFDIARSIARARPSTHGLIQAIPSIQVGGYCVPKEMIQIIAAMGDYYGISAAEIMDIFNTRFGAAIASDFRGRLTPARTAEALALSGLRLDDARIHVLGITYGPGVSDTRMSGSERAVREFALLGVDPAHITLTDPYAAVWPELQQQQLNSPESWGYGLKNQQRLSDLQVQKTGDPYSTIHPDQDVLLLATRHPEYVGLNPVKVAARMMGREGKVIVDTFDFLSDKEIRLFLALGWRVRALGKGHIADLEKGLTPEDRIQATEALSRELRVLHGKADVDPGVLGEAIQVAQAKLRALKAAPPDAVARREEYQQAKTAQELGYLRQQLKETRQWLEEDDPRVRRLERRVQMAQARRDGQQAKLAQLQEAQRRDLAEYMEESMVRPAMRRAAGIIKKSSFMHGVPAQFLLSRPALRPGDERKVEEALLGPARRAQLLFLAQQIDQAFHMMDYVLLETLTPDEMARMFAEVRHREETAHPERTLKPRRRTIPYWVYGNDGEIDKTRVTANLLRPFRWRTDLRTGNLVVDTDSHNWMITTLKQLPDLLRTDIPDHWGRYFVLVKPRLLPVEGAQLRAYPPAFDDLPPELALWLARDVVGKGLMLTTLGGKDAVEQDKILLAMVVDPHGAGSGRAGYLVWADSLQPVVSVTPEGFEVPVSMKGIGLFVGGDKRFPHTLVNTLGTTIGRQVSGGMTKEGTVGQARLAQHPGFVGGVGSEHGLTDLATTQAYHDGLAPRLVLGVNFRFRDGQPNAAGQRTEYFISGRQEFATDRMGWRFRSSEFNPQEETVKAAQVLGWNSAELLAHLPYPTIHIALTLDNVQANGYLTDPDSIVPPLYRERNPYGVLYKYFGFAMQQTVMGWQQMKASKDGTPFEIEDQYLALLRPWLRGFMGHLLESGKVRRSPLEKFNRLSRLSDQEFPAALRAEYGVSSNREAFQAVAENLIDTLWNHTLAYEVLKNRIQSGYSHSVESTYTGTANERFDPASAPAARHYLGAQRNLLTLSRRLIEQGKYPPLPFDFEPALEEIRRKEKRLSQLAAAGSTDFKEIYPLSFYKPEVTPTVSVLDLGAVQEGTRPIHIAGEVPTGASLIEKEVVTQQKAGAEEHPLKEVVDLGHVRIHDAKNRVPLVAGAPTVAIFLQAGASKRFDPTGQRPKVIAPLQGVPLGAWPIRSIEKSLHWPVISVVGHQADLVREALGQYSDQGIIFVQVEGGTRGGTGHAAYHAAAVSGLKDSDAAVLVTVGDRPLYDAELFQQAVTLFHESKADLVFGVVDAGGLWQARGKGRVILGPDGRVLGIVEQPDIDRLSNGQLLLGLSKEQLSRVMRVNGSLYVIQARRFFGMLGNITNKNAAGEYYFTDIVQQLIAAGGTIKTLSVPSEKAVDVTYAGDLTRLEVQLQRPRGKLPITSLKDTVNWGQVSVRDPAGQAAQISSAPVVAVFLQAGQDALFNPTGKPKVTVPLRGIPLGAWSIQSVQRETDWPVVSMVGHQADAVQAAISQHTAPGVVFAKIDDADGGTGYTAYSAGGVGGLSNSEGIVVVSVGDRPLYDGKLFQSAVERFQQTGADLVIGVVDVENPDRALGRGRIVRQSNGKIIGIVEQGEIDLLSPGERIFSFDREQLDAITTINGSLYVMQAKRFFDLLGRVRNDNTRREFFLPSLVSEALEAGGSVQTVDIPLSHAAEVTFPEDMESLDTELSMPAHHPGPLWARIREVMIVGPDPAKREFLKQIVEEGRYWVNVIMFGNLQDALEHAKKMAHREVPHCDCVFVTDVQSAGGAKVWGELGKVLWPTPTITLGEAAFSEGSLPRTREMVQDNLERIGISEVFPLDLWRWIVSDPERSGLRRVIERFVPEDQVDLELMRVQDLVERATTRTVKLPGSEEPLFDPKAPVALSFAPGRVRFQQGHTDWRGSGGQTINAATHYGIWALTQVRLDGTGKVVADNLDPKYQAFEFNLQDANTLPPKGIKVIRPDWLGWAAEHEDRDKWHGNIRAVPALIRTDYMDPEGRRRKEMARWSIRLLAAESTLPAGTGMASSSALPGVFARGLQPFLSPENRLNPMHLNDMDYVAYVGGDRAGTADMTAINTGRLDVVSVLHSYPERQGDVVTLPGNFKFFLVESGVQRIDAATQSPEVQNFAGFIKSMTGMGPALADLWLRHLSRSQPQQLGSLEQLLMTEKAGHPFGLLRELTGLGHLADSQYAGMVGGATPDARADFVNRVLALIPNDWTLERLRQEIKEPDLQKLLNDLLAGFMPLGAHRLDKDDAAGLDRLRMRSVIPLRQMAAYQIREIERGLAYVEAARNGNTAQLIELMRGSQDGDRSVWTLGPDDTLILTPWGETHPEEGFFRSLSEIDQKIDRFQRAMDERFGKNSAAARIMAAGLGGSLAVGAVSKAYDAAKQWWANENVHVVEIQAGGGATSVRLPKLVPPAVAKPAMVSAGAEELPSSPIIGHRFGATGIPGYSRLIYMLENGSDWQGGVVSDHVPPSAIASTAYVAPYSFVEEKDARLAAGARVMAGSAVIGSALLLNAQLTGSVAERALVHPSAQVTDSVLQPAFGQDDWSYSAATEGDRNLSVRNHTVPFKGSTYQVELGEGASANGSVLQDSFVGPDSRLRGSAVTISHLGPKSQLDGGVKLWLAVANQGHVNIAGVQHRADGTESPAALEWAEGAVVGLPAEQYPGEQFRERRVGYSEVVVSNRLPLVHYDGKNLQVEWVAVPPITLNGDYGIFSIFAGSPSPESIKTAGRKTPGVITRLTGGPGEQKSQHGRIVADPLSIVASFSNVIGRLLGFPEWDDSAVLLNEPEITHLGALSTVGVDAQLGLKGLEAWGQTLPGETRGQLGRASGVAPWVFLYSPDALFTLMGRLGEGYDDLPQKILESGRAFAQWMLDQEQAKGDKANKQVIERLNRYIAGYTALIDSGAWTGEWVQEGSYRHPAGWNRTAAGDWQTDRLSLEEMHKKVHPLAASVPYSQVSLNQLLALPPGVERPDWSERMKYYLQAKDLQTDLPTPLDQLKPVEDSLKVWRIIGQDDRFYYTVEGGRIDRNVNLKQIHPSALIGPGTVLTGDGTSVGEGSRLFQVVARTTTIGRRVELAAVQARFASIQDDVRFSWVKIGEGVLVGSGTSGSYVGIADGSAIAANTTFEPFALVIGSRTAAGNTIGVSLVHSTTLPGFMGRHLSTALHHMKQLPVRFVINGKGYDLGAASLNVAGGLFIQGRQDAPILLSAAYPLSLTTIQAGERPPLEIGAFSVLKNQVSLDGEILPLTFHAFNNLPSSDPLFVTPGRHNDRIGGALDFPGIFLRNFIYRTKKGIYDDLKVQGLSDEQIAVHPRLLQADYMVEATILQALRKIRDQLDGSDRPAYDALFLDVSKLIDAMELDLNQIEAADQTSLGRRVSADRQKIQALIAQIRQDVETLPRQNARSSTISRSGHTSAQLLDGIIRLAENLDGRWRMRNHTFTEVEWRYVAYDADGKPQDKWVPVAKPSAAGAEEIPTDADPLSQNYQPWKYEAASPMGASEKQVVVLNNPALASELRHQGYWVSEKPVHDPSAVEDAAAAGLFPVHTLDTFDPQQVAAEVKAGKRVILRTKQDRVGQDLWQMEDNREELQYLYGLVYDIAEGGPSLTPIQVGWVVKLLGHSNQAVAAAARDVIVKARVHHLKETVRAIAERVREGKPHGPYSEYYFRDAMTAFIDPVHKMELGSPTTPIFAGEMTEERMHKLQQRLELWVNPKKKLSLLTGSGQRMAAPIGLVEAGFKDRGDGDPTGFPSAELMSDIGSQPHDVVKVLFALVAKLFVENMPQWRQELGEGKQKEMPKEWSVAIGLDPRSTGPAIFQVAARIFRKMGVGVKFTGITSAPEAAARALLSDPGENLLASYEITPSHIKQGHQGTKLMLWLGQILPWAKAEEFNRKIRTAAQDFNQVKQVIEMLQDPALNAEIEGIMRRMPEEYADSKRRYHHYLEQTFTGDFDEASLPDAVKQLSEDLRRRGVTAVIDANGGARLTDLPLLDKILGGYVVIGADAAEFAHPLPPGEVSAISLRRFAERAADAFDAAGITPLLVNPDPDGDRKGIVYRDPDSKQFLYLDPQVGFMLDVVNLDMSAREAGKKGIGVASNDATTPSVKVLSEPDKLGYIYKPAEVGEANVVEALNQLIRELADKYGDRNLVSVGGGEGSAAAFIGDLVQVRDMAQAFGSMFNLYRKPEWVKKLIELLVEDPRVKQRLLHEVDTVWYQPGQLQYLMPRIARRILPPMRNADPGYETEVHLGVGIENQKPFKDTADRLLVQDGEWVRGFKAETAERISEVIGEPVFPDQIIVSEPINNIETHQLLGAGNRTLPDGHVIHDGGYEIQISYKAPNRTYYLYKLWLRRSKTEIGVTRRLILSIATFLPREDPATGAPAPQVDQFFDGLFGSVYPRWLAFLNDLEAEELMGHLEGRFGPGGAEAVKELSANLDTLLVNTPLIRKMKHDKLAVEGKKTYSKTDADNIQEQDAAARGAMDALKALLDPASAVSPLAQVERPSRDEIAYRMAWDLTHRVFEWKRQRFAQDSKRFSQVLEDLRAFASGDGAVYPNLVVDKILLSKEAEFLPAAGAEEAIPLRTEAESILVILTPETALAGLEELTALRGASGKGVRLAVIAGTNRQAAQAAAALETTAFRLEVPVISLERTGWNLEQAISGVQVKALQRNLDPVVVRTNQDLRGLGRLLVPGKSMRSWLEWLDRLQLGVEA